ncbi:hypothetical protein [Streptomyces herbicida]|uniref:hypothetical protein n=1 Tax=Streptomyces herbicida TaxID=3065675 RepID=UPI00293107F6|nr:hypothetical protein [Streptomyces sp. NEAU-HV9]
MPDDERLAAHKPSAVDFLATEGRSRHLSLSVDGVRFTRPPTPGAMPDTAAGEGQDTVVASARGTASDVVLVLYHRSAIDSLQLHGDSCVFDVLHAWNRDE